MKRLLVVVAATLILSTSVQSAILYHKNIGDWKVSCSTYDDTGRFNYCTALVNYKPVDAATEKDWGTDHVFILVGWDGADVMTFGVASPDWKVTEGKEYSARLDFEETYFTLEANGHIAEGFQGIIWKGKPSDKFFELLMKENYMGIKIGKRNLPQMSLIGSTKAIGRMLSLAAQYVKSHNDKDTNTDSFDMSTEIPQESF